MTNDQFLALNEEDQLAWLNEKTDAGVDVNEICAELGCTRADLQGYGYTWALGKWRYLSMKDRSKVVAQN